MQANNSPSPDAESIESSRLRSLARSSRALSEARPERISDPLPPDDPNVTLQTTSPSPFREASVAPALCKEYNHRTLESKEQRHEKKEELEDYSHKKVHEKPLDSEHARLHDFLREQQEQKHQRETSPLPSSQVQQPYEEQKIKEYVPSNNLHDGCNYTNGVIPVHVNEDQEVGLSDSNYHTYRSYRSSRAQSEVPDRGESEKSVRRPESVALTRASSEVSLGEMLFTDTPLESSLTSEVATRKVRPTSPLEHKATKGTHNVHGNTAMHTNASINSHSHINFNNNNNINPTTKKDKQSYTEESKSLRRALYSVHATRENALRVRHRLYHTVKHASSQFDLFQSLHYPFDDDEDDNDDNENRNNALVNNHDKKNVNNDTTNNSNTNANVQVHLEQVEITNAKSTVNAPNNTSRITHTDKSDLVNHPEIIEENCTSVDNSNTTTTTSSSYELVKCDDNDCSERKADSLANTSIANIITNTNTTNNNTISSTPKESKSSGSSGTNAFEGSVLELYTMGMNAEDTLTPSISAFAMMTLPDPISGAALVGICVGDTSGHVEYVEMSASESNSRRIRKSRASLAQVSNRQTSRSMSGLTRPSHRTHPVHNTLMPSSFSERALAESEPQTSQSIRKQEEQEYEKEWYYSQQENEPSLRGSNSLPVHISKSLSSTEKETDTSPITPNTERADENNNSNDPIRITLHSIDSDTNRYCHTKSSSNNRDSLSQNEHLPNRYSDPEASERTSEATHDSRTTTQTFASLQTNIYSTTSQSTLNSRLTLEARGRELVRRHSHRAYVQSINVLTSAAELPSVKCLRFVRNHSSPSTISYLTASEHVIKLFHVRRDGFGALDVFPSLTNVVGQTFCGSRYFARLPLQPCIQPYKEFGPTSDTIQSLDTCADGETFMSVEDLQVFWWHFEAHDTTHGTCIADCRPASGLMNDVEELITAAAFHPLHTSLYLLTRSSGVMNIGDLRDSPSRAMRRYAITSHITPNMNPTKHPSYDEILCSISTAAFLGPDHIVTRDYLSLKLWDLRRPEVPCQMVPVMEYVVPHLDTLYDNDSIFDRFPIAVDDWSKMVITGLYDNAVSVWQPLSSSCAAEKEEEVLVHYRVHASRSCAEEEEEEEESDTITGNGKNTHHNQKMQHSQSEEVEEHEYQKENKVKNKSVYDAMSENGNKEQHYIASKVTSKELQVLLEDNWLNKGSKQNHVSGEHANVDECLAKTVELTPSIDANNTNSVSVNATDNTDADDALESEMGVDKVLSLAIAPGGERFAFPSSNGQRLYVFERTSRNE